MNEHLKMIKVLQAMYTGKQLYIECYPTDNGAIHFPNSNLAVKKMDWPNFDESPIKEDGEDFDNYVVLARDEFVKEVNKQDWNTQLRMTAENLLIAYDQMRQRLTKTPNQ